jgi:uncharacterized protein YjbI with pentapeptide repeats
MKFEIRNRWSGDVQFECELSAEVAGMSYGMQLGFAVRKARESGAVLSGADLRDADLRGADLSGAVLSDAVLRGADLSGADASDWLPRIENIHQAVFAAASKPGALEMGSWHADGYCGSTHCRAGWVVNLAGTGGRVLEGVYGTAAAAALIYQASDPTLERVPDFYSSNSAALDDMKRLADAEAAKAAAATEPQA